MCNDSSIDFNEYKQIFEKVGEATETALVVLAEKMNPFGYQKTGLNRRDAAVVVNQGISSMWKKEFTLEFSRDRKSMSTYCIPVKTTRLGSSPKMFCKGAPEGVLERCTHVRVGSTKIPMTASIKNKILEITKQYGTGKDTPASGSSTATITTPPKPSDMDLADSNKFATYEASF
ncbi:hypothetical protein CEXT_307381 [Caerostris extrusa]|uniref:Uncharacterized protein n=1 Tax=Caerostris extrusa TaxID=172846 RepID=A0AAV4UUH5_CAEEX|nr:hypothetical protein CEXT_307381 [Caerostris extrusa]